MVQGIRNRGRTEIYPLEKGTVISAEFEVSAGNQVTIFQEDGSKTKYMHCNELFVAKGDDVSLNEVIATVGKTGNVTGFSLGFVEIF